MVRHSSPFLIALLVALSFIGCATNKDLVKTNSKLRNLTSKLDSLRMIVQEEQLISDRVRQEGENYRTQLNQKMDGILGRLSYQYDDIYLKIMTQFLNIRSVPSVEGNEPIAKAYKGSFLRRLSCASNNDCSWLRVEFRVGHILHVGYVSANKKYHKEMRFNRVFDRDPTRIGYIEYLWRSELLSAIRKNQIRLVGVYVDYGNTSGTEQFKSLIMRYLQRNQLTVRSIAQFNEERVTEICQDGKVQAIVSIKLIPDDIIMINLYDDTAINLYTNVLPLLPVNLTIT